MWQCILVKCFPKYISCAFHAHWDAAMMLHGPRRLPTIYCHPVTYYSNSMTCAHTTLARTPGQRGMITASAQWFSVDALLQQWLVRARARNLSEVWAGSVHWLNVSVTHRADTDLSAGSCSCESLAGQHLLHHGQTWLITCYIVAATQKKMDGKDAAVMLSKAHLYNNAKIKILCENIWS